MVNEEVSTLSYFFQTIFILSHILPFSFFITISEDSHSFPVLFLSFLTVCTFTVQTVRKMIWKIFLSVYLISGYVASIVS